MGLTAGASTPNSVVGGNPAKVICSFDALGAHIEARHATYPWAELLNQSTGSFDPALEPLLAKQRQAYFFGEPRDD